MIDDPITFLTNTLLTILGSLQLASGTFLILVGAALMALIMTILTSIDERLKRPRPKEGADTESLYATRPAPTPEQIEAALQKIGAGQAVKDFMTTSAPAPAYTGPTPTANAPAPKPMPKRKPRKKAKKGVRRVKRSYYAGTRG